MAKLKARLRRLCEEKAHGRLQVPKWLHDAWMTGDKAKLAKQLESCDFDKDMVGGKWSVTPNQSMASWSWGKRKSNPTTS